MPTASMLKMNQTSASPLAKPGPLKAFTAPVSISKSGDSKTQTEQDKLEMDVIPKSKVHLDKKTVSDKDHHARHSAKLGSAKYSEASKTVRNRVIKGSHSGSSSDKIHRAEDNHSAEMSLEAVVTLSKSKTGQTQEVRLIPSPPPGKPTTPRPSSAQRFRKMVLESRESVT